VGLAGVGGGARWRFNESVRGRVDVEMGRAGGGFDGSCWEVDVEGSVDVVVGFEPVMMVEKDLMTCSDSRGTYSLNLRWYLAWLCPSSSLEETIMAWERCEVVDVLEPSNQDTEIFLRLYSNSPSQTPHYSEIPRISCCGPQVHNTPFTESGRHDMATMSPPVPNGEERAGIAPDEEGEDEEDDPVLFSVQHVRTASVILPSGDRVRKRVSLMSIHDESPFDEGDTAALVQSHETGGTAGTAYSSIAPSLVDRGPQPWEHKPTRLDRWRKWLHSEGLKRFCQLEREIFCWL